jgi:hypothetical protein
MCSRRWGLENPQTGSTEKPIGLLSCKWQDVLELTMELNG